MILGEDQYFPINPYSARYDNSYTWKDGVASGIYNERIFSTPYLLILEGLNSIMPLWLVQWILFTSLIVVTFASSYLLMTILLGFDRFKDFDSEQNKRSSATLAAFFYTFNPFTLIIWYLGWTYIIIALFSFPLAFSCFLKGFKKVTDESAQLKQYFKWVFLSALIPTLTFAVHPISFLYFFLVISFVVYSLVALHKEIRIIGFKIAKYVALSLTLFFLLNLWWGLPYAVDLLGKANIFGRATALFFDYSTIPSTFLELFRLLGEGNFYQVGRVPAGEFYLNPLVSLAVFVIVLFSLGSLLLYKKRNRSYSFIIYFAFVFLLSLFITSGVNPPFGQVNIFAYDHVPFFKIFRAPWGKLMLLAVFALSALFAFSLERISQIQNTHGALLGIQKVRLIARPRIFFLILLIVLGYPIISGQIFATHGIPSIHYSDSINLTQVTRPYHIAIPQYYYDFAEFMNIQSEPFNVMILPYSPYYASFSWGYTGGWDFLDNILNKPIADVGLGSSGFSGGLLDIYNKIITQMKINPSPEDARILYHFLNIKYIVLLKDWNFDYLETLTNYMTLEDIEAFLPATGFSSIESFGKIAVYLNTNWRSSKTIYAANNVLLVNDSISFYNSLSSNFIDESLLDHMVISQRSLGLPTVVFQNALDSYLNNSGWLPAVVPPDIWSYMTAYPNATVSYKFYISEKDTYDLYAHLRFDGQRATLKYKIDNNIWSNGTTPHYGDEGELQPYVYRTVFLGASNLSQGLHAITFENTIPYIGGGYQNLRYFILRSSDISIEQGSTDISFVKMDPTKYEVHVSASKPFSLVFSESYDKNWVAYIDGQQVADDSHFTANGYANAWYINKTGKYTITLEFWPQNLFYIGSVISVITLILCVIYVNKDKIKHITKIKKS